MKKETIFRIILLFVPLLCVSFSCTKLNTKVYDQVVNFWQTDDQIAAGVAPAYSGLRNYAPANDIYGLNEVCTDEIIVPNRAVDWADEVIWEELWKHTWTPNNRFVQSAWQFIYSGIARVNLILQTLSALNPKPADISSIEAELRTIRAFYYYLAIDLYGNVPIHEVGVIDQAKLANKTRKEVFDYTEKELNDNLQALTTDVTSKTYGRATRWLTYAILAKLYLNAEVFTGTARWTDCIAACDAILNANKYSLEPNFFNNFLIANEGSKENIFVIPFDGNAGLGDFWIQLASLHYNSNKTFGIKGTFGVGGFNGHCSTAEYYNLFNPNDNRRKMFLVGQQYENQIADAAHLQYDRLGNLLSFDPVITSFFIQPPKIETAGARCAKWEFNNEESFTMSNDFAVFRLADIILMKAEAQFRSGDALGALTTINQEVNGISIRSRAGLPDFSASEMNLDGLLKERALEFSWEGWRRNDMIRFGHFTDARIPDKAISAPFRNLYPIPQAELAKNPYLEQNPGY